MQSERKQIVVTCKLALSPGETLFVHALGLGLPAYKAALHAGYVQSTGQILLKKEKVQIAVRQVHAHLGKIIQRFEAKQAEEHADA